MHLHEHRWTSLRLTVSLARVQARLTSGDGILSTKELGNGQSEVSVLGPAGSLGLAWQAGIAPAAARRAALGASGGGYETRLTSFSNLEVSAGRKILDAWLKMAKAMTPGVLPEPPKHAPFQAPWSYGNVPPETE